MRRKQTGAAKSSNAKEKQAKAAPKAVPSKNGRDRQNDSSVESEEDVFDDLSRSLNRATMTEAAAPTRPAKAAANKAPAKGAAKRKQRPPVLVDVVRLQMSTDPLIPRAPFMRLVRELMQKVSRNDLRLTPQAVDALRESSESYIVQSLGDAYMITMNRKQVTLQPRDIQLLLLIRNKI